MSKFVNVLTQSSIKIKEQRAKNIFSIANRAAEKRIDEIKEKLDNLDAQLIQLTDIYPDSELTTLVTSKEFDAGEWFNNLLTIELERSILAEELKIAQELYDNWFKTTEEV